MVARAKVGEVHQAEKAAGRPAPLSIAPLRAIAKVPAPPEVTVTVTRTISFIAGSSPIPISLAPPPLADEGMPDVIPRSIVFVESWAAMEPVVPATKV